MRTDHVLSLNNHLLASAENIGEAIRVREEEIKGLRKLQGLLLTAAEVENPVFPSFVSSGDEGFKRVAEAASEAERRNTRPVTPSLGDQAA
ncbi:hypothetical protein DK26_23275 [Bosea sp. WAO]|uniref:hypothetical protein n=1 Tax=Bosea sp. WAO TaxID=406341 RepID=UPI000747890B|nr:hypothetical protein [Bosea sp. WAO]KUL93445.1 hypothetical protein DK26_23275 [Bosea sp. WAO]